MVRNKPAYTVRKPRRRSLAVAVLDDVGGVGVDAHHAGDFNGDAGFLDRFTNEGFCDVLTEVLRSAR